MTRFLCSLILIGFASSCGSDDTVSQPATLTFEPPTQSELRAVEATVMSRDLSPKDVEVVHRDVMPDGRELRIYKHRVATHDHYGVIILPSDSTQTKFPIALVASGLIQSDLTFNANQWIDVAEIVDPAFNEMVLVLPSFRGRLLTYGNLRFQSTGDTCDAFDGSSDDAIALLNVAISQIPEADEERIIVLGLSRGGTIAHLVGQRDNRIDTVIVGSGLTDFNRVETQWYPFYDCHFLANRSPAESKVRILASSPLYFANRSARTRLHHGTVDSKVPIWNADEMFSRLIREGKDVTFEKYDFGHGISSLPAFQQNARKNVAEFLAR